MNQQKNGQDSLLSIFRQYEAPLIRYATRISGDRERARDVVQDVFLKLCRSGESRDQDHVAAWLYAVCRNRALDVKRKERPMTSLTTDGELPAAGDDTNPAQVAEQQEAVRQVHSMIEHLPENQQEVIRLKIEHGLRYREISKITGLSVSNVGYLLHTGLQKLRQQFAKEQPT